MPPNISNSTVNGKYRVTFNITTFSKTLLYLIPCVCTAEQKSLPRCRSLRTNSLTHLLSLVAAHSVSLARRSLTLPRSLQASFTCNHDLIAAAVSAAISVPGVSLGTNGWHNV
ncbi:hypothetical protein AAZX31_07G108900 [Glycine max]|eukprot:XP_025984869.1 uncharacterized protein LOC113002125 [Glycine max]